MISLRILPVVLVLHSVLQAKELEGVYAPTQNPCPSVEEAIRKMKVPDGYEVRNFAAEPMVINPVAMTWDHRGRLWVVELFEYPTGAKKPNEYSKTAADENFRPVVPTDAGSPRDRVVVLEDTDNDGKADKRTVFVEGLNLATAVLCGYGGVFVGQAPNLFFFRDTNGDDKADEFKTVLTGFGLEDRHELLNSFCWGPDGCMYFTHGVFTHSKVRRPGEPDDRGNTLNAGVYRVRFTAGKGSVAAGPAAPLSFPTVAFHEVYADGTSNPWGVDFDARGNAFVEACVIDHLFHMAPGGIYQRQGGAPENPYAYELLPSIVSHKHFRAAYAGIQVYQGGIYPEDTHGHVFFGNIHDNSIHEESLTPVGATFKAAPVRDFLRANDGWFRPVSIQTGPDGFLWVMDWCDKYPCYQNAQANPEGVDREKGRIWRVCYVGNADGRKMAGMSRETKELNMEKMSSASLLEAMAESSSNWRSRLAAVLLQTRPASEIEQGLKNMLSAGNSWMAQKQALGLLAHHGLLRGGTPTIKNSDESGEMVLEADAYAEAIRATPPADAAPLWKTFERLCGSAENPAAQAALATAIRRVSSERLTRDALRDVGKPHPGPIQCIGELFNTFKNTGDRTLILRAWMAFEPLLAANPEHGLLALEYALEHPDSPSAAVLMHKSARRLIDTRQPENVDLLLECLKSYKDQPVITAAALDGMLKAQEAGALKPAKVDPAPLFAHWQASKDGNVRSLAGRLATLWGDPNAVAALMGVVLDEKADVEKRIEAIRTVRRLKSDAARAGILRLLGIKSPDNLTVETLRAAGELGGMDLANAILKAWQEYNFPLRTAAAEVLVTRGDWANRLLDAVEGKWIASGKISASDIPVSVRRSLAQNKDLAGRAQQLLGAWNETNADVKALIAKKKKAALTGEPDLANGKTIFTTTCATCHKFHGGGQEVGPELIGSGRSNLDALLANVIDPNQIIGNGYENFIVITKDGRTIPGRVIEDTPTQMTLLGIGGVKTVVPRGDIQKSENTHQSLMPAGFGALPDDQFRDLIWYLLAPPEEGPLTKEKKELLIRGVDGGVEPENRGAEAGKIDWESVSLWNPDWKVTAPEFEGTPVKLTEYEGRKNVLQLHPFEQHRKNPAKLERTLDVSADKPGGLAFSVASHEKGDWQLLVFINGKEVKRLLIDRKGERWKKVEIDLSPWKGQKVKVSLENWANDWMYEFSYWSDLRLE